MTRFENERVEWVVLIEHRLFGGFLGIVLPLSGTVGFGVLSVLLVIALVTALVSLARARRTPAAGVPDRVEPQPLTVVDPPVAAAPPPHDPRDPSAPSPPDPGPAHGAAPPAPGKPTGQGPTPQDPTPEGPPAQGSPSPEGELADEILGPRRIEPG